MLMRRNQKRLWLLLLLAIVSHAGAGKTQELGESSCIAESAQAGGCIDEMLQVEGNGGSRSCEDSKVALGSSMLQVNSKTKMHEPEATKTFFQAQATKSFFSGKGKAVEPFLEMIHIHSRHMPTLLLVVLSILLACVCFMPLATRTRGVGDREGFAIGQEGRAASPKANSLSRASPMTPSSHTGSPVSLAQEWSVGVSPRSAKLLLSQQAPPTAALKHLCPGLVVPAGNECVLVVPVMPSASATLDIATVNVQDLQGKPVIQAEVVVPHSARVRDTHRPLVVLRSGSAPHMSSPRHIPVLAHCMEIESRKTAYLYNGRDELFAQVSKVNTNRYVLNRAADGVQLFFEGDILNHSMTVTNEQGLVVSESSSTLMSFSTGGYYYKLRVAAKVDVGLILCALFSMEVLERS